MNKLIRFLTGTLLGLTLLLAGLAGQAAAGDEVLRSTLANGLRVIIVVDHLAPVAAVQVNYLVGANETPTGFPGMAHALEHMMFRGSPGLSADQLATIMAALGGDSNAATQQTVTQYFVTTPVEELESALRVEAIRMGGVLATEELWVKERGAIEQEVARDLSEPMYVFHTRLLAHMFAGTPYAVDALGDNPSFDMTTGAMLRQFHEQWYGPNNAILIIVGDVDPTSTMTMVRHLYADILSRPAFKRPQVTLGPLTPAKLDMETDLPYGLAVVAYRLPGYDSPDYAAGRILGDVLDSQRARLYDLVTEGAALSAGFSGEEQAPASLAYVAAAFPKGGDGAALIQRLKGIIGDYLRDGVPAELVEAAKAQEIATAQFAWNSTSGLAFAWSQAVAVEGRTAPDDDIEAIRHVSTAGVNRVAREYLHNDTAITAVLTPREAGKARTVAGERGKEAFAPKEVKPVALPAWAEGIGELKVPAPSPAPREFLLDNGLRLIVLPSEVSPTVSLYGEVRTRPEIQEPPGKEGVAAVLDDLFSYGTTSLDRIAFRKALDDIAASATVGPDFSLLTLADKFERGVALLADNLLHPALPVAAFAVVRQEQVGGLAGERQSPDYHARRALLTALFPATDPVIREATPETVGALSLDDVRAYYQKVFRPDMTTIVVIGRIEPEEARQIIARQFGAWQASGPKPVIDLPSVPPSKPSAHLVPDPGRVQERVMLAQVGDVIRSGADYYPLQIGMHVLAGGFYATRFFRDLREDSGLVYTVDGRLDSGPNRSVLTVGYGCDQENVGKAKALIVRDLQAMQQEDVSTDELRQAKMLLLRQIPLSRASVDGIAAQYLALVRDKLPLDEPQQAAQRIVGISAGPVRDAFARRIRPDDLVQVTQGPTPQ
ncbi:MAG: insulinase family protein [Proteobacteria bacterium]|nr:insulinase family protein [Pseudomonadota bacterium]MCG2747209.1 insulinase family protein [Desulfobulbaceae bacterium]